MPCVPDASGEKNMLKAYGFYRGINLGGWLSQCDYSKERLDGFITEADIAKIADWGLDHVRIPFDYNVIQKKGGGMLEEGLERLDRALFWCEKYGLKTVLDLHKTQGFSFDPEELENGFFDNEKNQALFYEIWETLASRYGSLHGRVMFELLNEVTEEEYLPAWKKIAEEAIRRIRRNAPETGILMGSCHHNGVREVALLDKPYDSRVYYNFHCYEPLKFTHQGAYWDCGLNREDRFTFEESGASEEFFEEMFAAAIRKAEENGTELYCGEYGVIDVVPPEETLKWYQAIHAVLERHGIGRSAWSYKEMDFGLADPRMDKVREELLKNL